MVRARRAANQLKRSVAENETRVWNNKIASSRFVFEKIEFENSSSKRAFARFHGLLLIESVNLNVNCYYTSTSRA